MGPWTLYDLWSEVCQIIVAVMVLRWVIEKIAATYEGKCNARYMDDGRR